MTWSFWYLIWVRILKTAHFLKMVILRSLAYPCPKLITPAGFGDINTQHLLWISKTNAELLNLPDQNNEFYIEILKSHGVKKNRKKKNRNGKAYCFPSNALKCTIWTCTVYPAFTQPNTSLKRKSLISNKVQKQPPQVFCDKRCS